MGEERDHVHIKFSYTDRFGHTTNLYKKSGMENIIYSETYGCYIEVDSKGDFVRIVSEEELDDEFQDSDNWDEF